MSARKNGAPSADELIVCSLEAWDDTWRRNQFFVRELLQHDESLRVLFVEPPYDVVAHGRRRTPPRNLGLRRIDSNDRLWALRPIRPLPRRLGQSSDRWIARSVERAARRIGFQHPTLWINDVAFTALAQRGDLPTVYDITDDWLFAAPTIAIRNRLQRDEDLLLQRAEEVVVCSPALAASRGQRRDVHLIPNAVDTAHFITPQARPRDLPDAATLVYVGTLHETRLDVPLLQELHERVPAHIVLVGPDALSAASRAALAELPRIHILGARPYENVPAYLQHATAVVIPHVVSPFTESLDPIKARECLTVGRPTVATPVAGFRDLGPPVRIAAREAFADAVLGVLSGPRAATVPVLTPSWGDRATQFAAVLEQARARRARTQQHLGAGLALHHVVSRQPEG